MEDTFVNASLEELFTKSKSRLAALATPLTLQRIERLCQGYSLSSSSSLVFECPVDDDVNRLDFSLEVREDEGIDALMKRSYRYDTEEWTRIRSFCQRYLNDDSPLRAKIARTWLEYDTGSDADLAIPSLFVEFDNSGAHRQTFSDEQAFEALRQSASILNPSISKHTMKLLKKCGLQLPEGAGVLGMGVMLSRPNQSLRFCVNHMPLSELKRYLKQIKWPGRPRAILDTLPQLEGYEPTCRLAFDVGETVGGQIGVEIVAQPENEFREQSDWRRWLDVLVEHQLCTPGKRDILSNWLGESTYTAADSYSKDRVFRDISHFKFTFDANDNHRTKAYLHASYLNGRSLQGWFLHQFENLKTGAPPPSYPAN